MEPISLDLVCANWLTAWLNRENSSILRIGLFKLSRVQASVNYSKIIKVNIDNWKLVTYLNIKVILATAWVAIYIINRLSCLFIMATICVLVDLVIIAHTILCIVIATIALWLTIIFVVVIVWRIIIVRVKWAIIWVFIIILDLLLTLLNCILCFLPLYFFKHLKCFLHQTGNGVWMLDYFWHIITSQHGGHSDDELLLFVWSPKVLLQTENVTNDVLSHVFHLHVLGGGAGIIEERRKEDQQQVFLEDRSDGALTLII